MVPNGWQLVQLGDVVEFINGKAHENAINSSGKFIVVNSKFISSDGNVVKRTDLPLCVAQSHDVLMVMSDVPNGKAIAKCFYVETNELYTVNQRIGILRSTKIDSLFLYYVVNRNTYYLQFDDGLKQTNLRKDEVLNCSIRLPPLPEQRKIAQILSTWDKAIATTERLLANKQQQKKALMQRLLTGKQRFSGFEGEWKTVKFEDVLKIEIGGTPSRAKPEYWDEQKVTNNRWLSIANLQGSRIFDTSEYISDLGVSNSNVALIPRGTIVMSFKLTIGRRAILMNDCYTNEAICALIIKDRAVVSNDFLYQAIELVDFESEIDQAIKGKTLNKEKLKRLKLLLPNIEEQHKIASTLSVADAEIATIQNQLDNLKLQKKALMQQLLTGKRRVKVDEAAA